MQGWQSLQETAEALALEVEVVEKEEKINGIVTTATADWASDLAPAVTVMPVVPVVVVPVVVVQGTKTTLTGNHETTIDGVAVATTTTTIKESITKSKGCGSTNMHKKSGKNTWVCIRE